MGYMPPHDPSADPSVAFVKARVLAVSSTERRPVIVTFEILAVTKAATTVGWIAPPEAARVGPTSMPSKLDVAFHATRSEGQEAFYIRRAQLPDEQARLDALAQRSVSVPAVGTTVFTWLSETSPGVWSPSPDLPRWRDDVPPTLPPRSLSRPGGLRSVQPNASSNAIDETIAIAACAPSAIAKTIWCGVVVRSPHACTPFMDVSPRAFTARRS